MLTPAPGLRPSHDLPHVEKRWTPRAAEVDAAAVAHLQQALRLPLPMCRLLAGRGHTDADAAKQFLRPRLEQLHDPFELPDIRPLVDRLNAAIERGETILVHGDYDVDGVCAAALYTRVLRSLGARVVPFVPHRLEDGYDFGRAGVRAAADAGATLVLTADCGIVAHEPIAAAQSLGIDVLVTDHHTPGATLPPALAVVNPCRADSSYPFRALCGTGVAWKVLQALLRSRGQDAEPLRWYLDLVALATIADLVPLRDENRVLTHYGLRLLPQTRNTGLRALLRSSGLDSRPVVAAGQVSHVLAPRINAVGRMGAAARALELLTTDDAARAAQLAAISESENDTRRATDRATLEQALEQLAENFDPERDYAVVLAAEGWHPGVIGIVASRVVEQVHRPAVLIALDGETGRGSARSIPGFDLYAGIHCCGALLERYGGHRQAAGLEVRREQVTALRTALNEHARSVLRPDDLVPLLHYDLEITLDEATHELHRLLRHAGPHGLGNPAPVFVARGVDAGARMRVVGDGHVKLRLRQNGATFDAIGFRQAARVQQLDLRAPLDIAFQLHEDVWNGSERLQLRLLDVRAA
ncbi:MAG TPA: single-stranded-DNA-specific exonuclease RecJ [Longimicrobiales bacterium]|nr:single-stranded-DNA-specific exonuclease RecJ [Longimicrobiales bacterium]